MNSWNFHRKNKILLKEWWSPGFTYMENGLRLVHFLIFRQNPLGGKCLLLTYIHILDGCGCGCRYVIILKYTMKYLMRTWSWCERGWWKLSYGQLMIQILLSRRIHNMFLCQHFSLFFCLASFFTKKKKQKETNKENLVLSDTLTGKEDLYNTFLK